MSGHSKWSQIKRQKAVSDGAKAKIFSRFAKLIALDSKKAAGSQSAPSLASAIERAKKANMPKENIERAIAKGISKDSGDLEQIIYECYGPGGVAVIIDALTDNRNRTNQELKFLVSEQGLSLATPGSALWAFSKSSNGLFSPNEPLVEIAGIDEEKVSILLSALDEHGDVQRVFTNARGYESTENEN